ncbi:ABC transporter ATP-binding protein [Actinopolymorpha sp. B11F2]|uniref:ABC transporter ATP-binding protein n=1 Tax=Actinopolymorpha sp. B11F2 TaxID=3160862 RepID=UPI0032E38E2A
MGVPGSSLVAGSFRRMALYGRVLWASAPAHSLTALGLAAGSAAVVTGGILATGQLIGSLHQAAVAGASPAAAERVWLWLLLVAATFVSSPILTSATAALSQAISARYVRTFYDMVMDAGTAPHGVAHLEDPDVAGRLDAVINASREWDFTAGIELTWSIVRTRLTGVGSFLVLMAWHWWAPFVVAASYVVLSRVFTWWVNRQHDNVLEVAGDERRRAAYLRGLLTGAGPAKEVRLFGLAGWLLERYSTTWKAAMVLVWRNRHRGLGRVMVAAVAMLAANGLVLALLARDASAGVVSLAAIVTLVQAILALEAFGPLGDEQMALGRSTAATWELVRLRTQLGLRELPDPPGQTPAQAASPATAIRSGAAGIELRDVTFTYPTREEPTFTRLSLTVPAGQALAVVGENGVGKSTLIKLLCGLYAPDSGTVRIDGGDPAADDSVRHRVGVIFQDFVRYKLSLRRNVGPHSRPGPTGRTNANPHSPAHQVDDSVLARALEDAGGTELLERLEHGWDTILSPEFTAGTDLSGGQWQRVALARALATVASGAGILVLDEPTAALDVRAEAALFDRFLEVTAGMTTLLVSHRLSSVRHADRIVVIGQDAIGRGRVIEDGTHDQLLAAGGTYAQMFHLQARRFAAAGAARSEYAGHTADDTGQVPTP